MSKLFKVFLSFILFPILVLAADPDGYSVVNYEHIKAVKKQLTSGDKKYEANYKKLLKDATKLLSMEPKSVMEKDQVPPSGDKHDYMSMAAYWWPDPKDPNAPYIRKDGQRNPEIMGITDHDYLSDVLKSVFTLSLAYSYSGDEKFAQKALQLIDVWFLKETTRMNPNLNYAQFIKNKNEGRGSGIIDSKDMILLTDALRLLASSESFTSEMKTGMHKWLSEFFTWLTESKTGKEEAHAANNHGTWYLAQCSAVGSYIGKHDAVKAMVQQAADRITSQIEPDGKQPKELVRTISLHYSYFNLYALSILINQGNNYGLKLQEFSTPDGKSLKTAINYLIPYLTKEQEWPYPQIKELGGESPVRVHLFAYKFYSDQKYLEIARQFDKNNLKTCAEVLYLSGF